jgi:hypothetical protein
MARKLTHRARVFRGVALSIAVPTVRVVGNRARGHIRKNDNR